MYTANNVFFYLFALFIFNKNTVNAYSLAAKEKKKKKERKKYISISALQMKSVIFSGMI